MRGSSSYFLAISKKMEPSLLLPMRFGAILVNLPFSGVLNQTLGNDIEAVGAIEWLFEVGIEASEIFPLLLFIGRVVQKMGIEADPENHLLMHAVSANVAGQIASVLAGGIILSIVPYLL